MSINFALALALPTLGNAATLTVTAVNKLPLARASQTIELTAKQLEPLAGIKLLLIAQFSDRNPLNQLHCKIGSTGFRGPDI